jgi:hypothetical protein
MSMGIESNVLRIDTNIAREIVFELMNVKLFL